MNQLFPHIIMFPTFENSESFLSVGEYNDHIPFMIKRIYWVYGNKNATERGKHYHPDSDRVIICLQGSMKVNLENINGEVKTYNLVNANEGLVIPANHWISIKLENNAIMLAIASTKFEEGESINDYSKFEMLKNG